MQLADLTFDALPATELAADILARSWLPRSGSADSRIEQNAAVAVMNQVILEVMRLQNGPKSMAQVRDRLTQMEFELPGWPEHPGIAVALLNLTDGRAAWMSRSWKQAIADATRLSTICRTPK